MTEPTIYERRIDDLGRIVLPADVLKKLGTEKEGLLEIIVGGDGDIRLQNPVPRCAFCGKTPEESIVHQYKATNICAGCLAELRKMPSLP